MKRAEVLDTAKTYVTRDRQADHGAPEDTFELIAQLWTDYLGRGRGTGSIIRPTDVAMMMALLKIARQRANPAHADNYVDGCGYLAIAAELNGGEHVA